MRAHTQPNRACRGRGGQLFGLSSGYHLLRAFLVFGEDRLCVKSPMAYVEAEFFVQHPTCPESRCAERPRPRICARPPTCTCLAFRAGCHRALSPTRVHVLV
jgi:hypothetical protein